MGVLRLAHGPLLGQGVTLPVTQAQLYSVSPAALCACFGKRFLEPRHVFGFSGRDYPCDVRFLCIFLVVARALVRFFGFSLLKFLIVKFFCVGIFEFRLGISTCVSRRVYCWLYYWRVFTLSFIVVFCVFGSSRLFRVFSVSFVVFFWGFCCGFGVIFFRVSCFFRVGSFGFLVEFFLGFFASFLWVMTSFCVFLGCFWGPVCFWVFCGLGFFWGFELSFLGDFR